MRALVIGAVAAGLLAGCGDSASDGTAAAKKGTNSNSSGNPITAPVDYLGAVAKAKKTGIKVVDVASVNQAIQMFKTEEERYPKDLNELITSGYIPALPAPPYQMKYQYNAATGEVKIVPVQ